MKAFAWLMPNKKVNTNDLVKNVASSAGELGGRFILFLHYPAVLKLWSKLFQLLRIDWVPPRRVEILSYSNLDVLVWKTDWLWMVVGSSPTSV